MIDRLRVVIPVRSFSSGFVRLHSVMDAAERSRLARRLLDRTMDAGAAVGTVMVVTGDDEVAAHAAARGAEVRTEPSERGLDAAASAGSGDAGRWLVVHADLPLLAADDLLAAAEVLVERPHVLAPTHDGGTSVVGGRIPTRFAYGPGSFRRHLALMPRAGVVIRRALLLDLDRPRDLHRYRA